MEFTDPDPSTLAYKPKKKRNRRRRRIGKGLGQEINKKLQSDRSQIDKVIKDDLDRSDVIERDAKDELDRIKHILDQEKEAFISNIPFRINATELVTFINSKFDSIAITVVRCQIFERNGRSSGSAVVMLKNKQMFDRLMAMPSLVIDGRPLKIKEGNGQSKNRRRVKNNQIHFSASKLEIGHPVAVLDRERNIDWEISESQTSIEIEIDSATQILRISYSLNIEDMKRQYRLEISIKHIRNIQIERDIHSNKLLLLFRIVQRPHLFRIKTTYEDILENVSKFFGIGLQSTIISGIQNRNLWELDYLDERNDWRRTIDPSENNVFSRCQLKLLSHTYDERKTCEEALCRIFANPKINFIHDIELQLQETYDEMNTIIDDDNNSDNAYLNDSDDEEAEDARKISSGAIIHSRRVFITPIGICPQPPQQEASNRILRQFIQYIDHFIRVTFMDEDFGSILQASSEDIFEKRLRILVRNGIQVAGRTYVFLAYSNSQVREHGCWFYDENPRTSHTTRSSNELGGHGQQQQQQQQQYHHSHSHPPTAEDIRQWIGDLSSIKIVGKHAARLGQAFSDTIPTNTILVSQHGTIPDVERNAYCFSDGVGMISATMAEGLHLTLGLKTIPSAFQIRFGGMKGMLTVMPDHYFPEKNYINFRKSLIKFESTHKVLEINSYSKLMPAYLNRQIIVVLSSRGIHDSYFLHLLNTMINDLNLSLIDNNFALDLLYKHTNVNSYDNDYSVSPLISAWTMLQAGMNVRDNWYLKGLIHAVRNRLLLDIQNRARILIPNGVCLIGVMDETNTLEEGEVFVQHTDKRTGRPMLITCPRVVVGRSPCLHPGDIRVLVPRDVPALRHLVDVVVFPSRGSRPHPNEMGGGDLDGDIYFVIWDTELIPTPSNDFPPMSYSTASPVSMTSRPIEKEQVLISDIQDFFINYIKNDNLGQIANSHVIHSDVSDQGAKCDECILLAQLHSTAVDFIKTGIPAIFPKELNTPKCPSFMNNKYKEPYESTKVLEISYMAMEEYNDAIWQLMCHYNIYDEMELLSGHVLTFSRKIANGNGKSGFDLQGRLKKDVNSLRKKFRERFFDEFDMSEEEVTDTATSTNTGTEEMKESAVDESIDGGKLPHGTTAPITKTPRAWMSLH
eukprot:gene4112-8170_t